MRAVGPVPDLVDDLPEDDGDELVQGPGGPTRATVKGIADQLAEGRMTIDDAESALRGVQRTRRPELTWDQKMLGEDIEPGDDNDGSHLMSLVYQSVITY